MHLYLLPLLVSTSVAFRLDFRQDTGSASSTDPSGTTSAGACNSLQITGNSSVPATDVVPIDPNLTSRQDNSDGATTMRCTDADVDNGVDLGQSYRTNIVTMPFAAAGYSLVEAHFKVTELSITNGQDPSDKNQPGQDNQWGPNGHISWTVGRKASTQVSDWWKSKVRASGNSFNQDPGQLNFAFQGDMTLKVTGALEDTFTIPGCVIAQGSTIFSNNWWMGGLAGQYQDPKTTGRDIYTVRLPGSDSKGFPYNFYFRRGGSGSPVSEIKLTAIEASPYDLVPLLGQYKGEDVRDQWQSAQGGMGQVPPYVMYYQRTQASALRLYVKNNLVYDSTGKLFDTTYADQSHSGHLAIFVVDNKGVVYASNQNKHFLFHHSTILRGKPVASAGELLVQAGVIQLMTPASGHYRPPGDKALLQLTEALFRQGYNRDIPYQPLMSNITSSPEYNVTLGASGEAVAGSGDLTQPYLPANDSRVAVTDDQDCASIPQPVLVGDSNSLVAIDNTTFGGSDISGQTADELYRR